MGKKSEIADSRIFDGVLVIKPVPRYNNSSMLKEALGLCRKQEKKGAVLLGNNLVVELQPAWGDDMIPHLVAQISPTGTFLSAERQAHYSKAFQPQVGGGQ